MPLLLLQLASTLSMFGLIWFVQVVHYPLFHSAGEAGFRAYASRHATQTTYVVAPLMLVELGSAVLLLSPALRPICIPAWQAWAGAVLVALIWLSTGLLQVPLHNRLQQGYVKLDAQRLVTTNWIRTAAWSTRALLVLVWASRCVRTGLQ